MHTHTDTHTHTQIHTMHIDLDVWEVSVVVGVCAKLSITVIIAHLIKTNQLYLSACPGNFEVITGDGPLPMAIFELLEYIVNEVNCERCMSTVFEQTHTRPVGLFTFFNVFYAFCSRCERCPFVYIRLHCL